MNLNEIKKEMLSEVETNRKDLQDMVEMKEIILKGLETHREIEEALEHTNYNCDLEGVIYELDVIEDCINFAKDIDDLREACEKGSCENGFSFDIESYIEDEETDDEFDDIFAIMNTKKIYCRHCGEYVTFTDENFEYDTAKISPVCDGINMVCTECEFDDDISQLACNFKDGTCINVQDYYSDYGFYGEDSRDRIKKALDLLAYR